MRTRVVILADTDGVGGSERFVADVAQYVNEARFELILAGHELPELDAYLTQRLGRRVHRETVRLGSYHRSLPVRLRRHLRARRKATTTSAGDGSDERAAPVDDRLAIVKAALDYGQMLRNYFVLRRLLRRLSPDVLLVNNGGYPASRSCQIAPLAAKAVGVPRVVTFVHQYAREPATLAPRWELALDRRVDAATEVWVTPARGAADRLAAVRAVPRRRIRTIYLGQAVLPVPQSFERDAVLAELGLAPTATTLFVVAGLLPLKGQSYALQALAQLRAQGYDCHLLLVGDGWGRTELEEEVSQRNLTRHVTFLGFRDDVERLLEGCDLLVHPSLAELLPYVLKEAMARGVACVATDVGDTKELVEDGVTGRLVPPADPVALADAVRSLLDDPGLRTKLAHAGRERIRAEHDLVRMTRQVEDLLDG